MREKLLKILIFIKMTIIIIKLMEDSLQIQKNGMKKFLNNKILNNKIKLKQIIIKINILNLNKFLIIIKL